MARPVVSAAVIRELDRRAIQDLGIPGLRLMEAAGSACAEAARESLPCDRPGRVVVVCGKGNNGGDGFVAARKLAELGCRVELFLLGEAGSLKGDAALNRDRWLEGGRPIREVRQISDLSASSLLQADVVIDAIFGTGLNHTVAGLEADVIRAVNSAGRPAISADLPSGVSADTGAILGEAVRARVTVTFGHLKPGLLLYPGAAYAGAVRVCDIGLPPLPEAGEARRIWLMDEADLAAAIRPRPAEAHKGMFGHVIALAGSEFMPGAAALCCQAAMRAGAGLCTLIASEEVLRRALVGPVPFTGAPLSDFETLREQCRGKQALVVGPGLGRGNDAAERVRRAAREIEIPAVFDADGLNLLAGRLELLHEARAPRILTPHPGEAARLLSCSSQDIQADRLAAARTLAIRAQAVTVLKGARTIVADTGGEAFICPAGNPGMATGGTGDVLAGIIGGLLAQGHPALEAARLGVYVHALAGDRAKLRWGERGLLAGDLLETMTEVLRDIERRG